MNRSEGPIGCPCVRLEWWSGEHHLSGSTKASTESRPGRINQKWVCVGVRNFSKKSFRSHLPFGAPQSQPTWEIARTARSRCNLALDDEDIGKRMGHIEENVGFGWKQGQDGHSEVSERGQRRSHNTGIPTEEKQNEEKRRVLKERLNKPLVTFHFLKWACCWFQPQNT